MEVMLAGEYLFHARHNCLFFAGLEGQGVEGDAVRSRDMEYAGIAFD